MTTGYGACSVHEPTEAQGVAVGVGVAVGPGIGVGIAVGVGVGVPVGVGVGVGVGVPVAVAVGVGVGAQEERNKIDTLFELWLTTARSWLPSPVKSPTATEREPLPVPKLVGALKFPAPSPNKIDTSLGSLQVLATARSCLPSLLKSPTATE